MRNRMSFMIFFLLLVLVPHLHAQESSCLTEAQAWYDDIKFDELATLFVTANSSEEKVTERVEAFQGYQGIITELGARSYPECIERAQLFYLSGQNHLIVSLSALIDGDIDTFRLNTLIGVQQIGYAVGYLEALGVITPNAEIRETLDIYIG